MDVKIITDDKEAKVSLKLKLDSRIETVLSVLIDSGYWVHRQGTVQGEKEIWIDLKAPR